MPKKKSPIALGNQVPVTSLAQPADPTAPAAAEAAIPAAVPAKASGRAQVKPWDPDVPPVEVLQDWVNHLPAEKLSAAYRMGDMLRGLINQRWIRARQPAA